MHRALDAGDADFAVQQAAALEAVVGDVLVGLGQDGVARQDRVAVVAVVVDGVAAVGRLLPHIAGQELVLGLARPVGVALGMAQVHALDLLQEHHVGPQQAQPVAQVVDGEPPVELGEALVDVVGADAQGGHGGLLLLRASFCTFRHGRGQAEASRRDSCLSALAHAGPARRWSTPPRSIPVAAGEAGAGGVVAVPMRVLTPAGMFAPVFAGLAAIAGRVAPCPEVLRRAGRSGVSYRRSAREQLADRGCLSGGQEGPIGWTGRLYRRDRAGLSAGQWSPISETGGACPLDRAVLYEI